jgi:putative transposase
MFYLDVIVDAAEKPEYDPLGALGVDLGIENIAVDSDSRYLKVRRLKKQGSVITNKQRSILQKVGTKSAKRKLKKISGRERRFKKDTTNHVISKAIVSKAKGTARAIGMEDLKYIRSRSRATVRYKGSKRDRHSKWSFGELRNFVTPPINISAGYQISESLFTWVLTSPAGDPTVTKPFSYTLTVNGATIYTF